MSVPTGGPPSDMRPPTKRSKVRQSRDPTPTPQVTPQVVLVLRAASTSPALVPSCRTLPG